MSSNTRTVDNSTIVRHKRLERGRKGLAPSAGPRPGGKRKKRTQPRRWFDKHPLGTRARVKQDLHEATSHVVRGRDKRCVLCGETDPQKLTCGHFYKRGWIGTAFDLRNCNCLCKACNFRDNKNHGPYEKYMLDHYGPEVISELFELRNRTRHIPTWELETMLREYRAMCRRMKGVATRCR